MSIEKKMFINIVIFVVDAVVVVVIDVDVVVVVFADVAAVTDDGENVVLVLHGYLKNKRVDWG